MTYAKFSFFSVLLATSGLLGADCTNPPVVPAPQWRDGGEACSASCENQRRLQCPGASGISTPSGKSCEEVCRTTKADLHPECVADAADCRAVKACFGQ